MIHMLRYNKVLTPPDQDLLVMYKLDEATVDERGICFVVSQVFFYNWKQRDN